MNEILQNKLNKFFNDLLNTNKTKEADAERHMRDEMGRVRYFQKKIKKNEAAIDNVQNFDKLALNLKDSNFNLKLIKTSTTSLKVYLTMSIQYPDEFAPIDTPINLGLILEIYLRASDNDVRCYPYIFPIGEYYVYKELDEDNPSFYLHPHVGHIGSKMTASPCLGNGEDLFEEFSQKFNILGLCETVREALTSVGGTTYCEYDDFKECAELEQSNFLQRLIQNEINAASTVEKLIDIKKQFVTCDYDTKQLLNDAYLTRLNEILTLVCGEKSTLVEKMRGAND